MEFASCSWVGTRTDFRPWLINNPTLKAGDGDLNPSLSHTVDHLTTARYIMLRVTESHDVICSIQPKPMDGDWNGAGCHTNFSIKSMRQQGGYDVILKVCEAFGKVAKVHISEYGEDNEKRLTGAHETCSINQFKFAVADRGASIRIPRDAEKDGRGYMEDRRPGANCDPYRVTSIMMKTTGECLA